MAYWIFHRKALFGRKKRWFVSILLLLSAWWALFAGKTILAIIMLSLIAVVFAFSQKWQFFADNRQEYLKIDETGISYCLFPNEKTFAWQNIKHIEYCFQRTKSHYCKNILALSVAEQGELVRQVSINLYGLVDIPPMFGKKTVLAVREVLEPYAEKHGIMQTEHIEF